MKIIRVRAGRRVAGGRERWFLSRFVAVLILIGGVWTGCAPDSSTLWSALGLGAVPAEAASGPGWEEVVAKAKQEGKVTVLGPSTPGIRPSLIGAFQKAFPGVALEYQTGVISPLIPRLRAEMSAGKATIDVVLTGSSSIMRSKDIFDDVAARLLLREAIDPEKWRSTLGKGLKWNDEEKKYALQTSEWVSGYILVNSKLANPASVTSWRGLLDPKWKGKIASHDPRGSGAGQAVASYLLEKLGKNYIVELYKGQSVALTRSYTQVADWLAQGKYAIGIAQTADRIEQLRQEGIALSAYSLPDAPGQLSGGFSVIGIVKNSANPNAATAFLNWFLTRQGQEAFQRPHLYPSLRVDVPSDYVPDYTIPKPGVEYVDTYGEDFLAKRDELAKQVQELLGR